MNRSHWRPAYIGVGSNLESPVQQIEQALNALDQIDGVSVVVRSSLYQSAPMGDVEQPDFVNGVVGLLTTLKPPDLLTQLQVIEDQQGRDRTEVRWGPRTIDLDLLACGSMTMADDFLTLPHPGIAERNFVLLPWAEIAPGYRIPGQKSIASLAGEAPAVPEIGKLD